MAEPTWEEWLTQFNAQQPAPGGTPGGAPLAAGPGTDVLSGANRANIATLFDPNFGRSEVMTQAAENAIGGGWGAGSFAANQGRRLLDSERKANFALGSQLLEPYLQREFQGAEGAADRAARLQQIAAEGAQALQRLQLSEAGATARLNTETAAALQRSVLAGEQAMQQLALREAGETGRQRTSIQASLADTLLRAGLSGAGGGGGGGTTRGRGTGFAGSPITTLGDYSSTTRGDMTTDYGSGNSIVGYRPPQDVINAATRARDDSGPLALGSSSIDALLRKYGLLA